MVIKINLVLVAIVILMLHTMAFMKKEGRMVIVAVLAASMVMGITNVYRKRRQGRMGRP